ncbi:hypothetical protein ScPMuIL_014431 [Solemya velum]
MSIHTYTEDDWSVQTTSWGEGQPQLSEFDRRLTSSWEASMLQGHFKYILQKGQLQTKIIPGKKRYVAQLNVPRSQERRKPDEINSLQQPFQANKFNFTKIKPEEILFELVKVPSTSSNEQNVVNGSHDDKAARDCVEKTLNTYILCFQVLTVKSVELSLETILLSKHRGFHVGFNSLCAFASVNHLHLHAYYLEHELFVESCPVRHLCGDLYELEVMPTKGFAFQLHGTTVPKLARTIHQITSYFHKCEIAHNLHIMRGTVFGDDISRTVRLFLWPRKKVIGVKDLDAFNVAVVELAGHLPIKVAELFDGLTEESINETIRSAALEDGEYEALKATVMELCRTCH